MSQWTKSKYSRGRINRAGDAIRNNSPQPDDFEVLENWRASHAYIINTFQSNLRNRSRGKNITVAQRLKRRVTIIDKLTRQPDMQLSRMHDIAGCRLIFQDEATLFAFRDSVHNSRSKHKLTHACDKYDYILHPKESGYRGVHDVYEYCVSTENGKNWNGLKIELQYRTIYQHAWATAVEIADYVDGNRVKFSEADELHTKFFRLASEIISRAYEDRTSCLPGLKDSELVADFKRVDRQLGLMNMFRELQSPSTSKAFRGYAVLILPKYEKDKPQTEMQVITANSSSQAIQLYGQYENKYGSLADIVLVRGEDYESIREAFRNYFTDALEFVSYIEHGMKKLSPSKK